MGYSDPADDYEVKDKYDLSNAVRGPVLRSSGKARITIMLDNAVLQHFRLEAKLKGVGYQTAINAALLEWIASERMSRLLDDDQPLTVGEFKKAMAELAKR
jgi:uncharacterized protein (DUF4415 family)